jgi:hypothetical protein
MSKKRLAKRIRVFLKTYAKKTEDGEWNSPDAYQLEACANILETDELPPCHTFFRVGKWWILSVHF